LAPMSEEQGTMRQDEEVELLSRVDLFDSLSKEEIRQLLDENSDVRLEEGETFYVPGNKTASSSSSRRAGCASTEQKAHESSPSKC
jgi:hypothetical protein